MEDDGKIEAAKRCLAAARQSKIRDTRQALARCAERYILGALGYERPAKDSRPGPRNADAG